MDQGLILAYPFKKRTLPMVWRYNKAQVTSESLDHGFLVGQGFTEGARTKEWRRGPSPGVTMGGAWTVHACPPGTDSWHSPVHTQLLTASAFPSCS